MTTPDTLPLHTRLNETLAYIKSRCNRPVHIAMILGSGLGNFINTLSASNKTILDTIPFTEIPHFAPSTVEGHSGNLVIFEWKPGITVACLQGRYHYYEGNSMEQVTYPIRLFGALGVKTLLVSNAAGGINPNFTPGDLMLISDHINGMGENPLRGKHHPSLGARFPDMSEAYTASLRDVAQQIAQQNGLKLQSGVYVGLSGPTYETPAEIRMYRTLGADAIGMSTVPEVIVARQMGLDVMGISCITNMAAGMTSNTLNHQEVMDTAQQVQSHFATLFSGVLDYLSKP